MKAAFHPAFALLITALVLPLVIEGQQPGQQAKFPIEGSAEVTLAQMPFSWPRNNKETFRIGKQDVIRLLTEIRKELSSENPDVDPDIGHDVESFAFATFDDGPPYLLASADPGNTWFELIEVIRCYGSTCSETDIYSGSIDFQQQIVDLNHDGKHEFLTEASIWPARHGGGLVYVFGVTNDHVEDESAKFPEFYRTKVLPDLAEEEKRLAPNELNSEETVEKDRAALIYARQEMERRVLGNRTAGLSDAQQWEKSADDDVCKLAIQTYEAIETPEADAGLLRMTDSQSKLISMWAHDALVSKADRAANSKK